MNIWLRSHHPISPRAEWFCRSGRPAHVTLSLILPLLLAVSLLGAGLPLQVTATDSDVWPPVTAVQPLAPFTRGQAVMVSWEGHDPGSSGIQSYDLQAQDTADGIWTDVITGTIGTSTTFDCTLGHTYWFRVRGTDGVGNVEPWPPGNGDTYTTCYLWGISGVVRDNGGAPVQGAAITTWPGAISPVYSDADGAYAAYVIAYADTYTATVAKDGYGILPTTVFTRVEDAQVDLVLPPADNVVANSGFETGSLPPDWQTSGLAPAVVTSTLRHTGAQAACLGQPDPSFTTPANISNAPAYQQHWMQMIPDGAGGVHMLWRHGWPGSMEPVYYARRAGDGTWIVPPEEVPHPESERWSMLAIGPDQVAHIVGSEPVDSVGSRYRIIYAERPPDGSWSDPVGLSVDYPDVYTSWPEGTPKIAVSSDNVVHAAWNWELVFYGEVTRMLLASRDAAGSWGLPQDISDFDVSYSDPKMALDQTGGVHVVWSNSSGETKYACRLATGLWSPPIVIRQSGLDWTNLAVEADGTVHVLWSSGVYTKGSCGGAWSPLENAMVGGYPTLAVDTAGTVHMLWSEHFPPKLRYARRLDEGSWSMPQTLTGVPSYHDPQLALDNSGAVHALWAGGITGWEPGTMQLYHTYRRGDSAWSWPRNISGAAQWLARESVPEVFAVEDNGRVHAGWSDGTSSDMDVYYASSVLAQQTGDSVLSQTITVPVASTHSMLSFMYQLGGVSPGSGSSFGVEVSDGTTTIPLAAETTSIGWTHRWFDLQSWAGQTVTLIFTLHQVAGEQPAWACLDEVTVGSAYPDAWVGQSGLDTAVPGQQIVDVVTYGNRGGIYAGNGQVTLQLPPELIFVGADPPPSQPPPSLRWDVGGLAAHSGPQAISVTLQVAPSVAAGTMLTTTAAISSETPELEQANNSVETSIFVKSRAYLPIITRSWWLPACLVYSDDFSDPASGWPTNDTPDYSVGYLNGEYRIVVKDHLSNWLWVGDYFGSSDYRVVVDVRAASNLDGGVGLVFGLADYPGNFYLFKVSDGWFGLWRHFSIATWTALIDWQPSAAIHAGTQANRLEVVRSGDSIRLYANGQLIGETTDDAYHGSRIGLWSQRYSSDFDGRFDNFEVYTGTCTKSGAAATDRTTMSVESGDR